PLANLEVVKSPSNAPPLKISSVAGGAGDYLTVASSGNVGIGTTGPASFGTGDVERLVQIHASTNNPLFQMSNAQTAINTNAGIISFGITGLSNADKRIAEIGAVKTDALTTGGTGALAFATWNAGTYGEKMRILASGNVGIGTTVPRQKLDVIGTGLFSGNVGIGTTAPSAKLEVKGDVIINLQ
ncbi:MAG: hypothetical protein V1913_18720, partial [Fibrobacterota bacterium]